MDEYWKIMGLDNINPTDKQRREEAYRQAHDFRKFEIGLFWQRATYYWAFILAAFTAHFTLIGLLFDNEKRNLSVSELYNLPGLSLFALALTAFFCFFFSLCWVLMNKGSKFWQKNWESHIDMLQSEFSGNLYKTILNTENKKDCCFCPISLKAYDYSVSKITMITSVLLMLISLALFIFYTFIIISKKILNFNPCLDTYKNIKWGIGLFILVFLFLFSLFICYKAKGNVQNRKCFLQSIFSKLCGNNNKQMSTEKWINRDKLADNKDNE